MTRQQKWGGNAPRLPQQTSARTPQATAGVGVATPTQDTRGATQPSPEAHDAASQQIHGKLNGPSGLPPSPVERIARYYEQSFRERAGGAGGEHGT